MDELDERITVTYTINGEPVLLSLFSGLDDLRVNAVRKAQEARRNYFTQELARREQGGKDV